MLSRLFAYVKAQDFRVLWLALLLFLSQICFLFIFYDLSQAFFQASSKTISKSWILFHVLYRYVSQVLPQSAVFAILTSLAANNIHTTTIALFA